LSLGAPARLDARARRRGAFTPMTSPYRSHNSTRAIPTALRRSLVVATLVAAAAAPSPAVATTRPVTVTVQGDSLAVMSRGPLVRTLATGERVVSYSAQVGRHTDAGVSLLRGQRLGRVVVFALGTNDYAASERWYADRLTKVMKMVGRHRCVVLATAYARGPASGINRAVRAARAHYGPHRVQVADWASAVQAGRVRLADGVHPARASGARLRATLLAAAARRCAAPPSAAG
jgi:hypothetical protein